MHYEKEGDVFYSKNNARASSIYHQLLYYCTEKVSFKNIRENLKGIDLPFSIIDYGCADGKPLLQILPDLIREENSERDINIILNDKPDNDFKSVLKNIAEYERMNTEANNSSGLRTYFSAVSQDFYKQCVPNRVVSLGLCITAVHWMTKKPVNINDIMVNFSNDEEAKLKFAQQAEEDWEQFLLMRANELHAGGYLVVFVPGIDSSGRVIGYTDKSMNNVNVLMSDEWKKLVDNHVIDDMEMRQASLPIYYRTGAEIRKPFDDLQSKVIKSGLKLLSHDERIIDDSIRSELGGSDHFAELYAEKTMLAMKAVFYRNFHSALNDRRSDEEKTSIIEQYYDNIRKSIQEDVDNYRVDFVFHCLTIQKA